MKQSDLGKWLADGGDKGASAQLVRSLAALDERTEGAKRETQNAGRQAARDLVARITRDFTYHAPSRAQVGVYAEIRDRARTQAFYLLTVAPQSRELSLALSALEESVFWANAAIARNGIARSAPAPENALATADLHRYERPQEGDGRVPVCGTCGDIESSSVHAVEPAPSSIASAERPTAPFAVGERVREKHDPGAKPGIVERIEGGELWILWDDHGARGWAENEWDLYGYDAASALLGPE